MATKYISSLDGPAMDAALIDMAYHNSEAYAVGTRNGVEVGSSDVTYHNNAKYYASQTGADAQAAEAAAARAEAAVPAGTAGAVFFDRAQSLTTAQQAQARANIMAGGSNRNLLDNPWFTVNQRQITTPSSPISGYPADRWYGTYSAVTSDGVTIPAQNSLDLFQRLEPSLCAALVGKTVTVSTLEQDGTIASFTCVFPAYGSGEGSNYNMGNGIGCFVQNVSGYQRVRFRVSDARTTPFALRAAKLELGTYSTLANDAPPDYYKELDKCQWYFERIKAQTTYSSFGNGFGETTTSGQMQVPMHPKRTVTYTVSTSGSFTLYNGAQSRPVSALSKATSGLGQNVLCLAATATSLVQGSMYALLANNDASAYIDISADL